MKPRHWLVVFGVLSLGIWVKAQEPVVLPPGDLANLITQDVKFIQETLAKANLDAKTKRKVKIAALMVAQYAQTGLAKANQAEMATLRTLALKVLDEVEADKLDSAKTLAAGLSAKPKADPAAKPAKVALDKHLDFDLLMRNFSSERVGGFGLEKELEELADAKGPFTPDQLGKIQFQAQKIALIGNLALSYFPPEKEEGKKTKKAWNAFALQLQTAALDLAKSAQAKDAAPILKAAANLSTTCVNCHDVFR